MSPGPHVDRLQSRSRRKAGYGKRARHLVADALGRTKERIGSLGGRLDHDVVRDCPPKGAPIDPVTDRKTRGAVAGLVDDAGKVVSEASRHGDAEVRRRLGQRGEDPVHRIQTGGCHMHADLARAHVRFGNLSQLQYLGTSELLIDDGSAHG